MDLPYFVLNDTKIVYVYPTQFLVDMYAKNNSMLFTFKSAYTNPVVIPKAGKITITFSAKLKDPYRNTGALRTLAFPFDFKSEDRSVSIVVTVDQKLPLVYAPTTPKSLESKRIYEVSEEKGKLFMFMPQENPIYVTLTSASEITLPPTPYIPSCATLEPVACVGCDQIRHYPEVSQVLATKKQDASAASVTYAKVFNSSCAKTAFQSQVNESPNSNRFVSGFVLSPEGDSLIPVFWRETTDIETNIKTLSNMSTGFDTYKYYDVRGYNTFPMFICKTDTDCIRQLQTLKTYDTGISTESATSHSEYANATLESIDAHITQKGNTFSIFIANTSDSFVVLDDMSLEKNNLFTLLDTTSRIIPPNGHVSIPLLNKNTIQTSNQPTDIYFNYNGYKKTLTFKPITILILTIIEILSYLFVVTIGITLFSLLGIILYNKRDKNKAIASP